MSDARVRHDVSLLSDLDVFLFNEGTHTKLHERLGAHQTEVDGEAGTAFAVWAPNAEGVSVIGDVNGWDWESLHGVRFVDDQDALPAGTVLGDPIELLIRLLEHGAAD